MEDCQRALATDVRVTVAFDAERPARAAAMVAELNYT